MYNPERWTVDAACITTDPEIFFPEKGELNRHAKQICAKCPVVQQCLDYALRQREAFGIFGGLSAIERRMLSRAAS